MCEGKRNTAKEYLLQVKRLDMLINNKQDEIDRLNCLVTTITPSLRFDAVSGSGNHDKIGNAVARIIDLQAELNQAVDLFIDKKREIMETVDQIGNHAYIDIIYKRYFDFMTWERIACEMDKSYQWVCKLHGRALLAVEKILAEKTEFFPDS